MKKLLFVMMAILMVNVTTYASADVADMVGADETVCDYINGDADGDRISSSSDSSTGSSQGSGVAN